MASVASAPASSVNFPVSEPSPRHAHPVSHLRPPHLPFRRISLPTAPSLMHRESIISVASFDSLPEEGESPSSSLASVARNIHHGKVGGKGRPTSIESPRRRRRRDVTSKPIDDAQEAKRRKIIEEFYETEKAYVDGLELIYSHFLTPIIASLNTPNPLLNRAALTSVFSNFIDIWNLHRSFFSSLSSLLSKAGIPISNASNSTEVKSPPPLSSVLLSHFPYLSLYTPFVTSFPSTISALTDFTSLPTATHPNPQYSPSFASFLSTQEADPRCGKLKLRDWLLTIVQRCPRYLLLLKDLVSCTDSDDPEHAQLTAVHTLVSKITLSLNTSLHTHAQTLALLSLQRSTPNLPFQLIAPGRTLLKRGPLLQIERSSQPREREFLLFSDCLIWLAVEDTERAWKGDWGISRGGWGAGYTNGESPAASAPPSPLGRPPMVRSRSKSEAEVSGLKRQDELETESPSPSTPTTPSKHASRNGVRKSYHPPSNMIKRYASNGGGEERWVYKGRAELVDLEIIVTHTREPGEERRFELLSPEGSFVLYAGIEEERDDWCSAIRQAKAQLLMSLNITHPNSTLTSSSSTNHIRRSLQALPFPPSDDRIATIREHRNESRHSKGKGKRTTDVTQERRRKVEHWVPAIWIPDEKTGGCMRCGRTFGWRRRRHHCRLCGRCVCASCSGRTFFISDPTSKDDSSKPARACDACYETVFPLLDPPPDSADDEISHKNHADTIASLSNFPSWLSMPSLPTSSTPQALMAIDREPSWDSQGVIPEEELAPELKRGAVRLKSPSQHGRPRSYHQLLEDFVNNEQGRFDVLSLPLPEGESEEGYDGPDRPPSFASARPPSSTSSPRKENTARRNKRFSLPAVALQTTSVTARTEFGEATAAGGGIGAGGGPKLNKRFSLVLGGARSHGTSAVKSQSEHMTKADNDGAGGGLGRGIAAGKLTELLSRRKE
ncbi:FYVE, RhoGEF and PH domain-containing protein 6 [Hypsizygus marmoreus]|uniref:FYVE, RhoGEF and PH domain-containing protein 6 n=1 Tax=Hypsizygus marmoreus TaxID=39966 RepID=A0A369JTG7_HYPMA|nr:FYVE, RhoGEF and PH domain-containing protein 6 [Hypsizygus marmoreus]